jgi:hypothetical protein
MRNEKIWYQLPIAESTFFIVVFHFSLVKAVMSAPHLCKWRRFCLTGISHGAMVLTKRLHFFIFQLPKAEQDHCAIANCGGGEFPKLGKAQLRLQFAD